jgi:plastocyanin domain-containing protein
VRQDGTKRYLKVDSIEIVPSTASPEDVKTAPIAQDKEVQSVKVNITDNGFEPSTFQLKKGVPARVTFLLQSEVSCAKEIVISAYHIKRALPLNEPVVVEFTPDKSGEFSFACGMGMLKGKLVVQ